MTQPYIRGVSPISAPKVPKPFAIRGAWNTLFRTSSSRVALALFLALLVLAAPAAAQQYYYAVATGPTNLRLHSENAYCGGNAYTRDGIADLSTLTRSAVDFWGTENSIVLDRFPRRDANWLPGSWASDVNLAQGGIVTTSVSSGGKATAVWFTTYYLVLTALGTYGGTLHGTETLDLNTGAYTRHFDYVATYLATNGFATYGPPVSCGPTFSEDITGTVQIALFPAPAPSLSLALLNPYACVIDGGSCTAPPLPIASGPLTDQVRSAKAAYAISADGQSAAVIIVHSDSPDPVALSLSSQLGDSGIGTLTPYNPAYLTNPSPGTLPHTTIDKNSSNSYFCNTDPVNLLQSDCTFLALLWAPSSMPGNGTVSSSGRYQPISLTITATQDNTQIQTTTLLQPPPLVLVHGLWSSAAGAWPPFKNWLSSNYPHNLIFAADYEGSNSKAYLDPSTQESLGRTIADALACANSGPQPGMSTACPSDDGGFIARQVDVVAHSMGGLVTEHLIQNTPPFAPPWWPSLPGPVHSPVHRLITIGTPYIGTPFAATLWHNQTATAPIVTTSPFLPYCLAYLAAKGTPSVTCNLGQLFASINKPVDTAVQYMLPRGDSSLPQDYPTNTGVSSAITGQKPASSVTESTYNALLALFLIGNTDQGILGPTQDTLVPAGSQNPFSSQVTINGIVHLALSPSDTSETASPCFYGQAAYWLMGGSGKYAPAPTTCSIDPPNPVLDLTGYTQVAASNVSFSPAAGSALTINSPSNITATSSTKTITETLLIQSVSGPTDTLLLYSTQSPFSITFTPTRMGSTAFTAFALFSDMTYAMTTLNYTFQLSGNPLALNLVNIPLASLSVGATAILGAQALFPNGAIDVTQAATYRVRSGTTNVFAVSSTGVVTANGPGSDWLDVSYGGVAASAPISVGVCTYSLSPTSQLVNYSGESISIQVTTQPGCGWTADTGGAAWLTPTNPSGSSSSTITLNATANTTGNTQTAIIRVANQDVAVIQPATACTYTLSQTQLNVPAAGGSGTIGVTTSCPVLTSSSASWLSVVALSSSVGYSAAGNTSLAARSATMTIGTQTVLVNQPVLTGTTTTLVSSASSASARQTVTFTATVAPQPGGSTPTGSVSFLDGATSIGTATLNVLGVASFSTASLTVGIHSITASYQGDSNFASSASAPVSVQVNLAATTASVASSANPSVLGQSVTFTATVTSSTGMPSGTVTFLDGTTQLGSAALGAGALATITTNSLTQGTHSITVSYAGDNTFAPSVSSPIIQTVSGAPDFSVSASPPSQTVSPGQITSFTLTLTPTNGFGQSVSIACSGAPAMATCSPASSSVTLNGTDSSQVQVNVTTRASSLAPLSPTVRFPGNAIWLLALAVALCRLFLWIGLQHNQRTKSPYFSLKVLAVLVALAIAGCGGGGSGVNNAGTPSGSYTLTLTGSAGSGSTTLNHSVTVALKVN